MPPRFGAHIHLIIPKKWKWCRDVLRGMSATAGITPVDPSISEMVSHLGCESLAVRRNNTRLHTIYKIVHTTMGDPWQRWLTLSPRQTRGLHPWGYIPLSQSNDTYKLSFLPCIIPVWNRLPLMLSPLRHWTPSAND